MEKILHDGKDGTFLLFLDNNTGCLYIASRNCDGDIRFLKVYASDGFFGFTEPLQFESMDDLMEGFQYSPEMTNNGKSEAFIIFPPTQQPLGASVQSQLIRVLELDKMIERKTADVANIHQEQAEIRQRTEDITVSMKACQKTIDILNEQINLHHQSRERLNSERANNGFRENYERINAKKSQQERRMQQLSNEMEQHREKWDRTVDDMRQHEYTLDSLSMEREDIKRSLLDFNIDPSFICGLLDTEIDPELPHFLRENWYIDCDLNEAEVLLRGKPDGTFLVRRSTRTDSYTITFAFDRNVVNLRVLQNGGYYGLDDTTCIFQSLDDLIVRYSSIPLSVHDKELGYTTLKFPVRTCEISDN
ncbi:hypothetical protein ACJMK2_042112 [Sinanodonta woodiana]